MSSEIRHDVPVKASTGGSSPWAWIIIGVVLSVIGFGLLGEGISNSFEYAVSDYAYDDGSGQMFFGGLFAVAGQVAMLIGVIAQGIRVGLNR